MIDSASSEDVSGVFCRLVGGLRGEEDTDEFGDVEWGGECEGDIKMGNDGSENLS